MSRTAPPGRDAAHADREAFDHALTPYHPELLQAAQREVRHRLTLGQFAHDNPTPEQLFDMALQRAWRERRRLSPALGIKAWALASIMHEVHGVPLQEVALPLGIASTEAEGLLTSARRRVRAADKAAH